MRCFAPLLYELFIEFTSGLNSGWIFSGANVDAESTELGSRYNEKLRDQSIGMPLDRRTERLPQ